MLENVRGPVTDYVLSDACGKMPAGFSDVTPNFEAKKLEENLV